MKTLAKFIVLALVVLLAIPPLQYRTVSPCRMLEKELVKRAQQEAESAVEEGQEAVSQYGELVRGREYPSDEESVAMAEDAWAEVSELDRPDEE